eukprot:COSAG01_NODE_3921_length_5535_cov_44.878933_4_plen_156_part_00
MHRALWCVCGFVFWCRSGEIDTELTQQPPRQSAAAEASDSVAVGVPTAGIRWQAAATATQSPAVLDARWQEDGGRLSSGSNRRKMGRMRGLIKFNKKPKVREDPRQWLRFSYVSVHFSSSSDNEINVPPQVGESDRGRAGLRVFIRAPHLRARAR